MQHLVSHHKIGFFERLQFSHFALISISILLNMAVSNIKTNECVFLFYYKI